MLSLVSTVDKPLTQAMPEAKAKSRVQNDAHDRSDFQAYMVAAMQPAKNDIKTEAPAPKNETPAIKTDTLPAERSTEQGAQKAGHGSETELTSESVKTPRPNAITSTRDLIEALGLKTNSAITKTATPVPVEKKSLQTTETVSRSTKTSSRAVEIKNAVATSTLKELDRLPDLLLSNSDGLKKLSEKLGLAFLGKVSEKLNEKQTRTQTAEVGVKSEIKIEAQVTSAKVQKTGESPALTTEQSPKNKNEAVKISSKLVSRETNHEPAIPQPLIPKIEGELRPRQDFAGRIQGVEFAQRPVENIRVAVENPTLRTDMLRQFQEIITRANILVADSQNAQFSVKLYPRELGRMEIDLKLIDGEIRGKIVVESEEVKSEMQNFLNDRERGGSGEPIDLNRIDIEVRQDNQNAHSGERTSDDKELLQNLVTQTAAGAYDAPALAGSGNKAGHALYA